MSEIITRRFTRSAISEMSEYPFVAMHERSLQQVEWDQYTDTLNFVFVDQDWLILILKYPELAGAHID